MSEPKFRTLLHMEAADNVIDINSIPRKAVVREIELSFIIGNETNDITPAAADEYKAIKYQMAPTTSRTIPEYDGFSNGRGLP